MLYQSTGMNGVDDDGPMGVWDDDEIEESRRDRKNKARPNLRPVSGYKASAGVQSAKIHTPSGSATVQLPTAVPTQRDLEVTSAQLEGAINRASSRVNDTQVEVDDLGMKVASLRAGQKRLQKQQASQNMMSLVMTLLIQQQQQKALDDHKHTIEVDGATKVTSTPVKAEGSDNKLASLLPILLLGGMGTGQGESEGGSMNMLLLVLALGGGLK
jgi:hypothetical protein